ncbi:DNA-directed RNA polymerase subunit beta [Schinkia azotoformans MEV2011]|uniref:DNA-directed RNA polymerase subunit beta n=1 Tax=Schinkia azotoformans MEV2011 TaxID=1348973 RepID=A0A072NRK2_SCHAZ|nr:DNA-directed RNA polymerase subunit beta [Schinkia azotoformans]KEF35835.1 DNA-directed RNA polymerase subunit beta [Schinkia azotoformans MEV2011]MEC1697528.1 DNA-directed RNA polymerase subunit beta [Schinkia azotoformans]MEC1716472.1 DNA-directed RNA polymerase subunit beta [Schinkia azotoformans]MEC1726099.1 DNA-directed RNA polymerase subunit beta [Schinkia azotoformans]MEC1741304.1 DNA-directed RNA polymerase subunit beta [Schinkia azotoformans]
MASEFEQLRQAEPKTRIQRRQAKVVVILLVVSMTAGIMFGYCIIGSGKVKDALGFLVRKHLVGPVVKGMDGNK